MYNFRHRASIYAVIDLHTHTTASDGTLTPTELVQLAKNTGLTTLAITDHDSVSGISEASAAAKKLGLQFVPGCEFNIEVDFGEFHLLAYGIDILNEQFNSLLQTCTKNREMRNEQLCSMFQNAGIPIRYEDLRQKYTGQIGRPHFALFLKELGIVKSVQEGFDKYLAFRQPFYLKTKGLIIEEVIPVIHNAGGIAVLAHPMSLYLSWSKLGKKFLELKARELDGIEAWNGGTKASQCKRLEKLARQMGFLVTAGSDFHGKTKSLSRLGYKSDGTKIEDRYYTDSIQKALSI